MKHITLRLLTAVASILLAERAAADYIYAMIDDAQYKTGEKVNFDYATVKVYDSQDYLQLYTVSGTAAGTKMKSNGANSTFNAEYGFGYYAGFSGDASTLSFLFELWGNDDSDNPIAWQTFAGSSVSDHIFSVTDPTGSGGATPLAVTVVIPEPSAWLLVLLGMGALALRRNRAGQKMLAALAAAGLSGAALAAANDLLVTFSTKGPDTYADGQTPVLNKECYALVWDKAGEPFAIAADGSTTGGDIVLVAPVARKGRCPKVLFEVDAALVSEKYSSGGDWKVYLLDTRRYGENGTTLAPLKDGRPTTINASAEVAGATISVGSGAPREVAVDAGTQAGVAASLPAGFDQRPTIADIQLDGGLVYVTVENTVSYLAYDLSSGDTPEAVTERVNDPRHGGDDGTVILVAPAKEGGAFFKVGLN